MLNIHLYLCYVDKTSTAYPLTGSSFLTDPEYLLARNQGCEFAIKSAFYIHPKEKLNNITNEMETIKPFYKIFKDIQASRRNFPKGHLNNMLYKEIGNGIYGNVCRGGYQTK
jgi:hypothetical protein